MTDWLWIGGMLLCVLAALTACVDHDDAEPLPKPGLDL